MKLVKWFKFIRFSSIWFHSEVQSTVLFIIFGSKELAAKHSHTLEVVNLRVETHASAYRISLKSFTISVVLTGLLDLVILFDKLYSLSLMKILDTIFYGTKT
jgi:hypothetical protein